MYIYNMWRVVASQRKHVATYQPKCRARHIANVNHIDQCDNSEQDCDDEALVQQKTNARHLMNGHLRCY